MRRPVKISSETASARSMPLARRKGFDFRSARAASSSGKASSFADVLGIVELLEPIAVATAHRPRLLRVEAAADQVDVLLPGGIDPNIVPRHMAELARDPKRHCGPRVPGEGVGRQEVPQTLLEVAALEEHREAGDLIDRQDVRAAPEPRRSGGRRRRSWSIVGGLSGRTGASGSSGSGFVIRSIQRATSARKLSGNRSSGSVSGSVVNGEARIAVGQPGTVRPKWFHMAIVCLMTLRGCLVMHSASRASCRPTRCCRAHLIRRDAERGAVVRQPLDPLQVGPVLDALEKRAPSRR